MSQWSRRQALGWGLIGSVGLAATACAPPSTTINPQSAPVTPGAAAASTAAAFPRTITHALGTATIPAPPQRVVALGSADVQIARALNATLVGAARNDYRPDGQWLGVEPPLGDDIELLAAIEPNLEQIAALRPDLILITTAQPSFGTIIDRLSQLAPVVAYRQGLLQDSGDDLVRLIGQALGQDTAAEALIADSQRRIEQWAADHSDLAGSTIAFGQYVAGQTYLVVAPTAPSTVFFTQLGMTLPAQIAALPVQAPPGITTVAAENLALLDTADTVVLGVLTEKDRNDFLAGPIVSGLEAAEKGDIHFVEIPEASLILAPNPAVTTAVLDVIDKILVD